MTDPENIFNAAVKTAQAMTALQPIILEMNQRPYAVALQVLNMKTLLDTQKAAIAEAITSMEWAAQYISDAVDKARFDENIATLKMIMGR